MQNYLVREVQSVYRSQRVDIDDKHIEIIISQMLRKVKVETMGDTGLLPGSVIDKFAFREVNDRLRECVKIKDPGDSRFEIGKIISKEAFEEVRAALEAEDKKPPSFIDADAGHVQHAASGHHQGGGAVRQLHLRGQLPGNHQGADRGGPGGQGRLPGRPEGERDPGPSGAGGTGFHMHQDSEVRISQKALEAMGVHPPAAPDARGHAAGGDGGGVRIGRTVKTDLSRCKPFLEVGLATLDQIELFHGPFELA